VTAKNGDKAARFPTLLPWRQFCWLVSKFHDFTVSFKSLTWPKVGVAGTLWLSDLLSA
jgi:hypothetical protein